MAETKSIDPKYLSGIKFRTAEAKKVKVDGVDKTRYTPVERDLKPADVMDWADKGDSIMIATTDGRKHIVEKGKGK